MIHRRRALGEGVKGVVLHVHPRFLKRRIPDRQRVEGGLDAVAQMVGRLMVALALGGELELPHRLHIKLEDVWLFLVEERLLHRPFLIGGVPRLEVFRLIRDMRGPKPAVFDIALDLVRVRIAPPVARPVLIPPARQRADARTPLMVHHVVGVVGELGRAVLIHQPRQAQLHAQLNERGLEPADVAVGLDHRPADAVRRLIRAADRTIQQRNAVMPFQIGRVRQDQVGEGHHLRRIGVGIDDLRDDVFAVLPLFGQHIHHALRVHRRVPGHVGHVHEEDIDRVRIARIGVRDHHMHQPVGRHRMFPRKRLVDAFRRAVRVDGEVFRPARIAEMRPVQRLAGRHLVVRRRVRLHRFRIGRLEAHAPRNLDRPQKDLQQVNGPAGLKPVGMGRDAAHGVHRHRAADHLVVLFALPVGPGLVDDNLFLEGRLRQLRRDPADRLDRHATSFGDGLRRVVRLQIFPGQQLEHRGAASAGKRGEVALHRRFHARLVKRNRLVGLAIPNLRLAVFVAHEEAEFVRRRVAVHKEGRIRVADEVIEIDLPRLQQFMDQRQYEQTVRARRDPDPFVGDGVIA